ncbi:hypothetical protein FA048_11960 [Pedobacter polaris]|uniref:Uncharacterized protein n=1 Tax=Pedobacter polaris TaxID=2571273 RepID=A0A4U1CTG5_9SPHI|nr:hypothetical protein [Pedobacter polaris]TKC10876.1 hypothetical protein FA048_11960 [Pedobacter polaris]
MDQETAKYIVNYFSALLTDSERLAIRHTHSLIKLDLKEITQNTNYPLLNIYKRKGWITEDIEILNLLKEGYDNFEVKAAERIMCENCEKVFLNNCPSCNKLARTPEAKQCRFCSFNWR